MVPTDAELRAEYAAPARRPEGAGAGGGRAHPDQDRRLGRARGGRRGEGEGREDPRAGESGRGLRQARAGRRATTRRTRRAAASCPPSARGQMVPEFEQAAFAMQPGRDRRAGQDAVRVPRHQARLEESRARADLRGGAGRARGRPLAAQDRGGGQPPRPRARREGPEAARPLRRGAAQAAERRRDLQHDALGRARRAGAGDRRQRPVRRGGLLDQARQGLEDGGLDGARARRSSSRPRSGRPACRRSRSSRRG